MSEGSNNWIVLGFLAGAAVFLMTRAHEVPAVTVSSVEVVPVQERPIGADDADDAENGGWTWVDFSQSSSKGALTGAAAGAVAGAATPAGTTLTGAGVGALAGGVAGAVAYGWDAAFGDLRWGPSLATPLPAAALD